jgi:hypothetical protein
MKTANAGAVLFVLLIPCAIGPAGHGQAVREKIEWCDIWVPEADSCNLPRILLIGDSITRAYYPLVDQKLKGKACVARLATSKSVGDPVLIEEVALVLAQYKFDIVHFNNGLHGWGFSEEDYREHFPRLLDAIRKHAPDARLIWAATTPVRKAHQLDEPDARTDRVKARNAIARELVSREGIFINDLFSLAQNHPEHYSPDGVHFSASGIEAQADQVARSLLQYLK